MTQVESGADPLAIPPALTVSQVDGGVPRIVLNRAGAPAGTLIVSTSQVKEIVLGAKGDSAYFSIRFTTYQAEWQSGGVDWAVARSFLLDLASTSALPGITLKTSRRARDRLADSVSLRSDHGTATRAMRWTIPIGSLILRRFDHEDVASNAIPQWYQQCASELAKEPTLLENISVAESAQATLGTRLQAKGIAVLTFLSIIVAVLAAVEVTLWKSLFVLNAIPLILAIVADAYAALGLYLAIHFLYPDWAWYVAAGDLLQAQYDPARAEFPIPIWIAAQRLVWTRLNERPWDRSYARVRAMLDCAVLSVSWAMLSLVLLGAHQLIASPH